MNYGAAKEICTLIADDSADIRQILKVLLESEGHKVVEACDGLEALKKITCAPDLVILDINMPFKDGFSVCTEIRKTSTVPILFLTARDMESDKIFGLSAGGDDYISKPFSNGELLARVKTLLRRSLVYQPQIKTEKSSTIDVGNLSINTNEQNVSINHVSIPLTRTEYDILLLLATNQKKIFSLDNIYESVWGSDSMGIGDNAVMAHIKNLRRKLGDDSRNPQYIKTAWGKGYYIE